jgi:uncharacterized protein YkwD
MNWIDLILIIILLLGAWAGWKKGFILVSMNLLTLLGSITVGFIFYSYAAGGIDKLFPLGVWSFPVAFVLTIVVARILIGLITRNILRIIPEETNRRIINRFLGIIPGTINGFIYATIIAALILVLPFKKGLSKEIQRSKIARTLSVQAEWANKKLAPVFDDAVRQTMNDLSAKPGEHAETELDFTYDDPEVRPDLETMMLDLINKERAKQGLHPLKVDKQEAIVARAHSKDMFVRGYFAHTNPDGKDPFDRMKEANLHFSTAGENLALAQTLETAHKNLMNSPGHRANILNPTFNRVGIGIQDGGFYGLMISQEFRN